MSTGVLEPVLGLFPSVDALVWLSFYAAAYFA